MTLHDTDDPSATSQPGPDDLRNPAGPVDAAAIADDDVAPHDASGHPMLDRTVFGVAAVIVLAFIAWGVFGTDSLSAVATTVLGGVITGGGWAFVLAASGFVVFAIYLAMSR